MNEKKIQSIQALRGISAILVVLCHSEAFTAAFLPVYMEKFPGHCFGGFGVDIFFVISGFIMVYINRNDFGNRNAVMPFITRRLIRILPMYWLTSLLMLAVIIPSGLYEYAYSYPSEAAANVNYILLSFLLIPIPGLSGNHIEFLNHAGWSLAYEMYFYFIFSFLIIFNRRTYLPILCGVFGLIILFQLGVRYFHCQWLFSENFLFYLGDTYGNSLILEFIFGCFVAEKYLSGKVLSNKVAISAIIFSVFAFISCFHVPTNKHFWELRGLELIFLPYHARAIFFGVPALLVVYGFLSLESNSKLKVPNFLVKLGDASYSIYLTHSAIFIVILLALIKQLEKYVTVPGDFIIPINWIICIGLGYLCYIYIEYPMTKFIKELINNGKISENKEFESSASRAD